MTGGLGTRIRAILDRAVRTAASFTRARRRALFALAGAALAAFVLYGCDRNEQHIVAELDRLSRGEGPGEFFARFDYICFDSADGVPKEEFTEAAAKKKIPITVSWSACGVDRSCCSLNSEQVGVVGLVKGYAIRCVELRKVSSAFFTEPQRAMCAKPSELVVKRETFTKAERILHRSWLSRHGQTYYSITEKQP
ncbi:MAG TPA: hypothetical protein VNT79_06095 [Phycisphaerae bacterium]|nr:hypothetical protein [Phycisphaerae bacterium]